MAEHNTFGKKGEELAKAFLEAADYEILEENWTFGKSEIDLIAYKDQKIIFVEVKTRSSNTFGDPEEFVHVPKQKKMTGAADEYIYLMSHQGEVRFDIISILFNQHREPQINHIEDAFWP
jgi:putative endonuclease